MFCVKCWQPLNFPLAGMEDLKLFFLKVHAVLSILCLDLVITFLRTKESSCIARLCIRIDFMQRQNRSRKCKRFFLTFYLGTVLNFKILQEHCKEHPEKTHSGFPRMLSGGKGSSPGLYSFSSSVWLASPWHLSSVLLGLEDLERLEDGRPVIVSSPSQFGFIWYFLMTGPRLYVFGQHVTEVMLDSLHSNWVT